VEIGDSKHYLDTLRQKWETIPFAADDRARTTDLLSLDDTKLFQEWEKARRSTVEGGRLNDLRGWYQLLYRDWCRGRKIMDIGCGLGIDGIHFAENDARVTFVDLVESNIELVRRICRLKGIEQTCSFLVMRDVADLARLDRDYDAVMGFGSLMHAPLQVMKPEFDALTACLKPGGGRFIMHAYPKKRWEREGSLAFDQWGAKTDGEGTPWAEWYDAGKLIDALKPARFELVHYCEYRQGDMNCIDLVRSAVPEQVLPLDAILFARGDLARAVTYWEGASLQPASNGLDVTTGPICWSYAAEIPLSVSTEAVRSQKRFRLSVKASAQHGEVGLGILSKDGKRFLLETRFDPRTDREQLSAEVHDLENIESVIVRNTCRDSQPSKAFIEDVRLYRY
jgi:2-polyprenyl-3-methyl-5-hydroxy-6-metoxy-1,4-benzoquinol methylase